MKIATEAGTALNTTNKQTNKQINIFIDSISYLSP